MTFTTGDVYEGEWLDDKYHGQGTYTDANGHSWQGEWKNDKKHNGFGFIEYKNGNTYTGKLTNGYRNGHGIMTFTTGDVYEGEWLDDKSHGQGIYIYANGNSWQGEWKNNTKYNGFGVSEFKGGVVEFKGKEEKYTDCKVKYVNGDRYEGKWNFKQNMKQGHGTYYKNGKLYEQGEFNKDQLVFGVRFMYLNDGSFLKYDHNNQLIQDTTAISALEDKIKVLTELINQD